MPTLPLTDCVIRPSPSISLNLSFFLTYFFFSIVLRGMWGLGSPTMDRTCVPCIGSAKP